MNKSNRLATESVPATFKPYDTVVFIGRFQAPVHNAHKVLMERAHQLANNIVIVIGSANQPRSENNPFTIAEREKVIREVWESIAPQSKLQVTSVEDRIYNDQAWAVNVQAAVQPLVFGDVALIGHKKDESSFYLDMFPQWEKIDHPLVEPLNAAKVRDHYFTRGSNMNFLRGVVPEETFKFLDTFRTTPEYEYVLDEKEFIANYKKQFATLPYPPVFVTSDAVVIQSGHVLLVKRRGRPGRGQLAFPGGFLKNVADKDSGPDKSMEDCMIRELYEETKIKVAEKILRGNIRSSKVFDAIKRSARGRTITHAFNIVLPEGEWNLPKVRGSDDAAYASWIPISEIKRENCFEDHYDILMYFLGRSK